MNIEHIALNISDPVATADWYARHLGMKVLRQFGPPSHARFIADAAGRVVLELYCRTDAPIPDYAAMDPLVLHVAFAVSDVKAERARLLAAGASAVGDVTTTDSGDTLAMLRDPWGISLQLVKRAKPMMGPSSR